VKPLLIALLMLLVFQAERAEAQLGDPQAGAGHWRTKLCRNCHGDDAQGGFGPDLAGGRGLTVDQFRHAIRQPWGVMLGYTAEQLSEQQVADLYAFVQTKPKVQEPGEWHWKPAPVTAPLGQQLYMQTVGCGQCHEPENGYGRMWLGEHAKEVDFDYFAKQIYEHTDKYPRGGMGNYSRARLPEPVLREIYQWMVLDIGMRASVGTAMRLGERQGDQTTFNVMVSNRGVQDVGLDVEGITLFIKVPSGTTVVSGTGTGYSGVQPLATLGLKPRLPLAPHPHDNSGHVERPEQDLTADVVVWKIPSLTAGEELELSFVLAGPAPTAEMLRQFAGSTIHWETPGRNDNARPPTMVYRDLRLPDEGDHESVRPPRLR
jgi:mono/diheme cytochrome c family protein